MTNEEKSKAIADFLSIDVETLHKKSCYLGAREMAKWKDEQFKKQEQQLIDKACEWLKNNIDDYYTTNEFEEWFDNMFEDFKQAMKGE